MKQFVPLLMIWALCGCASPRQSPAVAQLPTRDWRTVATEDDRVRLREWRAAFAKGLSEARNAGYGEQIAREGALLEPDAAQPAGALPNGSYRCRTIKLGARTPGMLTYASYPYFACRIRQERDLQGFAKLTGSQRQVGLIFPHDAFRRVFLGTLVLGDESRAMQYGRDPERDVAGYVERIGPDRWRLVMPRPHFESQLDVLELVPDR